MTRALSLGLFAALLVHVGSSHAAADEDPFVAMCKRDGKNLVDDIGRAKTSKYLENDYDRESRRVANFESTCITGPKVAAVKATPGYADVTTVHAKVTSEIAALKKQVEALQNAEKEKSKKRQEEAERQRIEQEKRDDIERAAQVKKREAEAAAEKARRAAEDRAYLEKKAKERCTQGGQLAKTCYAFFTTIDTDHSKEVEYHGYVKSCLSTVTSQSPDVGAAEQLLAANVFHAYAAECLRMMDAAQGADWRKPVESRKKRAAFASEVESSMRNAFRTKCGVSAWLEAPPSLTVVLEKKSTGKGTFLSKKNPDGDLVTIYCSGQVVTQYASGGSMTSQPKTEAGLSAERNLRACAIEKAKYLCRGGKNDFESGVTECVRVAESACH